MDTEDFPVVLPSSTMSALTISLCVHDHEFFAELLRKFSFQSSSSHYEHIRTPHSDEATEEE